MATASWPIMASITNRVSSGRVGVADVGGLAHQLLVDAEAAGGVDDDDVVVLLAGVRDAAARDVDRVPTPLPGSGANVGTPGPLADDLQLVDRVGPLQVARHQQRRVALPLEPVRRACRPAWSCRSPAGRPA